MHSSRMEPCGASSRSTDNRQPTTDNRIPPYFLASNRFIERKNLARLIEAYSSYVQQSSINNHQSSIWHLCLLGDGELKSELIAQCDRVGLQVIEKAPWESFLSPDSCSQSPDSSSFQLSGFSVSAFSSPSVFFPGFRQIDALPMFYAHAGCFIHPALEEPWGLVINEAMACGLPVLSGSNVGAAEELVDDGVNGWCFDAENVEEISTCLGRIATLSDSDRNDFGAASTRILEERCPTEAFGRGLAQLMR